MITNEARRQLAILSLAMVLGMTPWFAATVVAQPMSADLALTASQVAWLTLAVQLGFVLGSLTSAALLLSDRFSARQFAARSALVAAVSTAALVIGGVGGVEAIGLRLLTGAALAGVYPPGIKIAAGWSEARRGTAIGVLVGALTLGTGAPHLLRLVADLQRWRPVLLCASGSALASALVFWRFVREGPFQSPSAPFDPRALGNVFRTKGVVLATGGYLGHMWELFAMWSSIGLFLGEVVARFGQPPVLAPVLAFSVIGVGGAVGCIGAGFLADRIGKSRVTIIAMAASGACALSIGALSDVSFLAVVAVAVIWGISVVADSAQFSACVTTLAPAAYVGTAVTTQTALGFLLTMLTIRLVPSWVATLGWQYAYVPLAAGPALGILAMWRLWVRYRV